MSERVDCSGSNGDYEVISAGRSSSRPYCSVCIANYNGESLLTDCLESIRAQPEASRIEILVHDDASGDDSVSLLRERYPDVTVLVSHANVGFCESNNRLVAHARGEFILLLNNDAALFPDALATLFSAAQGDARGDLWTLPQHDWTDDRVIDRGSLLDLTLFNVPNLDPARGYVACAAAACLWMPRALWVELGGFPVRFGSLAEDTFLCTAARLAGRHVRVASRSGYRHHQGMSFGGAKLAQGRLQTTYRRRRLSERNRLWIVMLCTPGLLVWPWLACAMLAIVIEAGLLAMLRLSLEPWREIHAPALAGLVREWRWLRARRMEIQKTRRIGTREYLRHISPWPRKLSLLLSHGLPRLRQ